MSRPNAAYAEPKEPDLPLAQQEGATGMVNPPGARREGHDRGIGITLEIAVIDETLRELSEVFCELEHGHSKRAWHIINSAAARLSAQANHLLKAVERRK